MRINRFVRVTVVFIVGILSLSCAQNPNQTSNSRGNSESHPSSSMNSGSEALSNADGVLVPSFFKVGGMYVVDTVPRSSNIERPEIVMDQIVRVLKIDNSGWIHVEKYEKEEAGAPATRMWLNISQMKHVTEWQTIPLSNNSLNPTPR